MQTLPISACVHIHIYRELPNDKPVVGVCIKLRTGQVDSFVSDGGGRGYLFVHPSSSPTVAAVHVVLMSDLVVLLTERDQKYHLAALQDLKVRTVPLIYRDLCAWSIVLGILY